MSVGAPYRESEVVDLVERACPTCRTRVYYVAGEKTATCSACDTRFAISIDLLPDDREPREFQTEVVPYTPYVRPASDASEAQREVAHIREGLLWLGGTVVVTVGFLAFTLGGGAVGGLFVFAVAWGLLLKWLRQRELPAGALE